MSRSHDFLYLKGLGLNVLEAPRFELAYETEKVESFLVPTTLSVPKEDTKTSMTAEPSKGAFDEAFDEAYASALTKFDTLESYFANGMGVLEVAAMLEEELRGDKDFQPALEAVLESGRDAELRKRLRELAGRAHGLWKKSGGQAAPKAGKAPKVKDVFLPWSSIDAYPEWVAETIDNFLHVAQDDQQAARLRLENKFLKFPLCTASVKYDGTCFGKLDTGGLVGRKHTLVAGCDEYQKTSTAAANGVDAGALRQALSELLGAPFGRLCIWGELMCNPNFYGYTERGLFESWLCFGVVAELDLSALASEEEVAAHLEAVAVRLQQNELAYSLSGNGRLRLLLCPALRRLLVEVAHCVAVEDEFPGLTHAEVVARGAADLRDGNNEGLVLAFFNREGDTKASLRKWKNSAEGGCAKKHAAMLKERLESCQKFVDVGQLDRRVVEMLATMIDVAEAQTQPRKKGRGRA